MKSLPTAYIQRNQVIIHYAKTVLKLKRGFLLLIAVSCIIIQLESH